MKLAIEVIEKLSDDSFPPVHLINGKWGCGKTYFIKNFLIKKLRSHFNTEVHYFSLYGTTSISDFKDKIISAFIFNRNDLNVTTKSISKTIDGAFQIFGRRGTGAVINGIAGAIKQAVYTKINNCIIILDDLERITDDSVIRNILGECLYLAEEKKLKIIIVANTEKLKCNTDIEKAISSSTNFSFTTQEITDIFNLEFNKILSNKLLEQFSSTVNEINASNIRALKKAIYRFTYIYKELSLVKDIRHEESAAIILDQIIRICYSIHECQYSRFDIIDTLSSAPIRRLQKKSTPFDTDVINDAEIQNKYNAIEKVFSNSFSVSDMLIQFCDTGEYLFKEISDELHLPKKKSLLDLVINKNHIHKLTPIEFDQAIVNLELYIQAPEKIDLFKWFSSCDIYLHLIDRGYIEKPALSIDEIINTATNIKLSDTNIDLINRDDIYKNFYHDELYDLFVEKRDSLLVEKSTMESLKLNKSFIQSWSLAKEKIKDESNATPFIHLISEQNLILSIQSWPSEDIFEFAVFLYKKYSFENIEAYLIPDHTPMVKFKESLLSIDKSLFSPQKKGAINDLIWTISTINTRMEIKLSKIKR